MATSPSNAATDNYFKVFTKPKPSVAKHKNMEALIEDINQSIISSARRRGGSVSKVESSRMKESSHKRRATQGPTAAVWGLNLI